MINYTVPLIILLLDVYIMYRLFRLMMYYRRQDMSDLAKRKGRNRAEKLFIANTFATIGAIVAYLLLKIVPAEILLFIRFADRYVMLFAYRDLEVE